MLKTMFVKSLTRGKAFCQFIYIYTIPSKIFENRNLCENKSLVHCSVK